MAVDGLSGVTAMALGRSHTVAITDAGEVFTWGANTQGQLGYTSDGQTTPRRITTLP